MQTYLDLHRQTGVRFSWGLVSGGTRSQEAHRRPPGSWRRPTPCSPLRGTTSRTTGASPIKAKQAAAMRPRGWPSPSCNEICTKPSRAIRCLKKYPVWSISEGGAEVDNVGLQFLTIPEGAGTLLPAGTRYADSANVHNYIYHPSSAGLDGQQDVECRRSDLCVQGRWPVRQLRRHLGEALSRLFGGRAY